MEDEEEDVKFPCADYVVVLPLELDKYGMATPECYVNRVNVIKNLLAAGLKISWFTTEEEDACIVRISATDELLSNQAELMSEYTGWPFMVRTQDKYRDNYVEDNESFVEYKAKNRTMYTNAFVKTGGFRFCSLERMRLVHAIMMAPHDQNGANLGEFLNAGKIVDVYPMHDKSEIEFLEALWFGNEAFGSSLSTFVPEKEIRDYFGEKVALYACFASFYTSQLAVLAPVGVLCAVAQVVDGEDTIVTPMYAVVVALWATVFLEMW